MNNFRLIESINFETKLVYHLVLIAVLIIIVYFTFNVKVLKKVFLE